jgi:hypothetical protein
MRAHCIALQPVGQEAHIAGAQRGIAGHQRAHSSAIASAAKDAVAKDEVVHSGSWEDVVVDANAHPVAWPNAVACHNHCLAALLQEDCLLAGV